MKLGLGCLILIRQERSALRVRGHGLALAEGELAARPYSGAHDYRQAEEYGHDDEGKDPLERNKLALELSNTQRCRQDAELDADCVVLVGC